MLLKDKSAMLIVVDVNVPAMTECPELLKSISTIVVLDHHRQSNETIKNAVVSYVEPYASSTCEMVAEILQYIVDKPKLKNIELMPCIQVFWWIQITLLSKRVSEHLRRQPTCGEQEQM